MTAPEPGGPRWLRSARGRDVMLVLWAVLAAQAVVVAGTVWSLIRSIDRDRWAPLYGYDEQVVVSPDTLRVESVTGEPPVVTVSAQKCAREPVTVTGRTTWVSDDPRGAQVDVAGSGAVGYRTAGCAQLIYHNQVPPNVLVATRALGGDVRWRITGSETPVSDHRVGAPALWRTVPIRIIVET